MPSVLPIDSDIEALVVKSGLPVPKAYDFTNIAAWAIDEFQRRSGRVPFLQDSVDVARSYDPPGAYSKLETAFYKGGEKVVELDAGLLSCTSVALGVTADNPAGQDMDLARQLRLMPANAPAKNQPYEWIEFFFPVYGSPSSVVVTGKWGYCPLISAGVWNIPQEAWSGIQRLGAQKAAKDMLEGIFASPTMVAAPDIKIQQDSFRELGDSWGKVADMAIARFKLLRLGL